MAPLTKDKKDILEKVKRFIGEGSMHCGDIHTRVEENARYERGEQWSQGDIERQTARERPAVPWNSIGKVVNVLANREITERYNPKAFGRTDEDAGIANALDEACRWQRDLSMTEHAETLAVRRQVASGWGVMHKYWDPTAMDGAGMIRDEDIPIWYMLWPSRARDMNIADRRWHVYGKWVPKDEAEAFYGDRGQGAKKFFSTLAKKSVLAENASTKLNYPAAVQPGMGVPLGTFGWGMVAKGFWVNQALTQIFIIEAEWLEYEKTYRAAVPTRLQEVSDFKNGLIDVLDLGQDPQGNPIQINQQQFGEMDSAQQSMMLSQLLEDTEMQVVPDMASIRAIGDTYFSITGEDYQDYREVTRNVTKYAVITDNQIWESGERPYGYTFEFITGYPYELRDKMDFYGVVDMVKGPQDFKNALISGLFATYLSSNKGNVFVEQDLVPNIDEFMDNYAKPIGIVPVPPGFVAAKDQRWATGPTPVPNPIAPELMQIASGAIEEMFALSSIDFGTQGDLRRVSGTVVQSAKTASNTVVALLFDSIRKYRKRYGLLNIKFIQHYYDPQELIRIVGQDKMQDLQGITSWDDIDRFDIKIDEEPVGITERIDLIDFLTRNGTIDRWLQSNYITFDDLLDFFLPQMSESDKRKLRERRKQRDQQQAQVQQVQQQLQDVQTKLALFQNFVLSQPNGKQMNDQWNRELGMAKVIADQQQQQQQAQGGAQQ